MKKYLKNKYVLALSLIVFIRFFTHVFGPPDTFPRVQQSSISSDGFWKVEIIKRKESFCPFSDTFISIKITDVKNQRISDIKIFRTTSWNTDNRKYQIRFEPELIILNDFWVIDKEKLNLEMCPSLECLNKNGE